MLSTQTGLRQCEALLSQILFLIISWCRQEAWLLLLVRWCRTSAPFYSSWALRTASVTHSLASSEPGTWATSVESTAAGCGDAGNTKFCVTLWENKDDVIPSEFWDDDTDVSLKPTAGFKRAQVKLSLRAESPGEVRGGKVCQIDLLSFPNTLTPAGEAPRSCTHKWLRTVEHQ